MTTRHPTARRVHRPPPAPDDVFVANVLDVSAWAKTHARTLIFGGIAAAVLIGSILILGNRRATTRAQADLELTQVRGTVQSGNTPLAIRDLESFLTRFAATPAATEARLMLGQAYLLSREPASAIEAVAPVADDVSTPLGVPAALLLAAAHEAAGQTADAERVYLRLAEGATHLYQQQDAYDNAARIRVGQGNAAGAAELYDRILEITPPGNPERPVYEMRRAEVLAGTGTT